MPETPSAAEYERILDLVCRIEDRTREVSAQLPDHTVPGNSRALEFAKQIEADAQELRSQLTARAYEIGGETACASRPPLEQWELTQLGTYNSERHRGIVHSEAWQARMALLQERFHAVGFLTPHQWWRRGR